jgi:AcrR family transcriptional regulator
MRSQKVEDHALLNRLFAIIRAKGYDGSTLNDFAEASGLQKASLYHRFPGGKEEITSCVLNHIHDWIKQNIYDLLMDKTIPTDVRLKRVIKNINVVYDHGDSICLLRALSKRKGLSGPHKYSGKFSGFEGTGFNRFIQDGIKIN